MKLEITKEEAQFLMDYISSTPSGNVPLTEGIKAAQILLNLKEIKEKKDDGV